LRWLCSHLLRNTMNNEKANINLDHIAEQWVKLLFADMKSRKEEQVEANLNKKGGGNYER
jgi:hypothetical protein